MPKTKKELTSVESGGLLVNNVLALGFFFGAATAISVVFFPLYIGYFIASGLHIYKRKLEIAEDLKNFITHSSRL